MPGRSTRTAKLDLRLSPEAKQKLQTAAESAGRTVSEFVLESALVRADETLADRTRFGLDAERWKAFMEALDAPPREIPASAACSRNRASLSAAIDDGRSTPDREAPGRSRCFRLRLRTGGAEPLPLAIRPGQPSRRCRSNLRGAFRGDRCRLLLAGSGRSGL